MLEFRVPAAPMRGRMTEPPIGLEEGDRCQRQHGDGTICMGRIEHLPDRSDPHAGCSCHLSPPCSFCTSTMPECQRCGWRSEE